MSIGTTLEDIGGLLESSVNVVEGGDIAQQDSEDMWQDEQDVE